jgi:hypothetical protein
MVKINEISSKITQRELKFLYSFVNKLLQKYYTYPFELKILSVIKGKKFDD